MSGHIAEGYDWLVAGISSTLTIAQLEAEGWYFHNFPNGATFIVSIQPESPGTYGYGNRLQWSGILDAFGCKLKLIGSHNAAGGWVSESLTVDVGSTAMPTIGVFDAVNNIPLINAAFGANGVIFIYVGSTLVGNSDAGAFPNGVVFDAECHFKVNSTTGDVEVRINTESVVHLTNINTQPGANAYFDSVSVGAMPPTTALASLNCSTDNLRYYDTAGAINNTWLGTYRVQTSLVNGDGGTLDFSRSNTGLTHWQNIINQNIDDTLYLFDPTTNDFNLSTIAPLVNSPTVAWIQVTGFYRQDDATQRSVKNRIVSAGVTQDGAQFFTPQTYAGDSDTFELDPATGVQFTGAGVNALQIGPLVFS